MYLYSKDVVDGYGNGLYGVGDSLTREQFVKMLLNSLNITLYKNETTSFSDIEEGSWYEYYVETAIKIGIVNGISENEFGTGMPISRQDMAVMAKRAIDYVNGASDEEITDDEEAVDGEEVADDEEAADTEEAADDEETVDDEEAAEDDTEADETEEGDEDAEPSDEDEAEDADEAEEAEEVDIEALIAVLSFNDNDDIADYALAAVAEMAANGILTGNEEGSFLPRKDSTRAETAVMVYRIMMAMNK